MKSTTKLDPNKIRTDGGTQPRAQTDQKTVTEYSEDMQEGAQFPAVVVFYDGTHYWLADGFHRVLAARVIESREIEADVRPGTQRDAILYACGANAAHGMRRSNEDKRRAVLRLLQDSEWGKWSDNIIAQNCAVSQPFVSAIHRSLKTVLSEPAPEPPRERAYTTKHGTKATMDTGKIGRRPVAAPRPDASPTAGPAPRVDLRHPAPAATADRGSPLEREPPPADRATPKTAVAVFRDYVDIIIGNVSGVNAKHMVINEMIKYLRELSIELNRKAGAA